jgi:hypothetical protein
MNPYIVVASIIATGMVVGLASIGPEVGSRYHCMTSCRRYCETARSRR